MSEVVGEDEVSRERVGESLIEVENFDEAIALYDMKVTVGEAADTGHALTGQLIPVRLIPEDITLAFRQTRDKPNGHHRNYRRFRRHNHRRPCRCRFDFIVIVIIVITSNNSTI